MADASCESAAAPRRWLQLRLSTLLLLVTIAALSAGWFADRRRLEQELQSLRRETVVIQVTYLQSDHLVGVLTDMFPGNSGLSMASDTRSNSIVVSGSAHDIDSVKAALGKLDRNVIPAPAGATPR